MESTVGTASGRQRVRVAITGAVQGVGFRPFVYRLATGLRLPGWVSNSSHGVQIEVEGSQSQLNDFLVRLTRERPPRSFIQSLESTFLDPVGFDGFEIRESVGGDAPSALVLPDIAVCDGCVREMNDPSDRRYRYPFINCTNCGPRFSIIEGLPYDRPKTTMKAFRMCDACRREYDDPLDRRFHAQPIACPVCGPHLELWDGAGRVVEQHDEALREAADAIRRGQVVAVKGLGGFQLLVDARHPEAVAELRRRKGREEKPFALMYPALDLVRAHCEVSPLEERLLLAPEAPIVLLRRVAAGTTRDAGRDAVAGNVAPGMGELGAMLPYTPLHHLLMMQLGFPVVATSGNVSDEPICIDEREALTRLAGIADLFLVHDRPIVRHVDDSVARVVLGRELVVRRARGYAPLPVRVAKDDVPVLAVGAHLKNAVALCANGQAFVSQHIGDLETEQALRAFRRVIDDFRQLYALSPGVVACDAHPDYLSTAYARQTDLPAVAVQHHEAHVLACIAENELRGPVLGVSWDGTGFGPDGTVWGGEFLLIDEATCERCVSLRTFPLPGGDRAVKEPRRSALGVLLEAFGPAALSWSDLPSVASFSAAELKLLGGLVSREVNTPRTSSAGRLFDAVASLAGLYQRVRFEGQAAMALQAAAERKTTTGAYDMPIRAAAGRAVSAGGAPLVLDWGPAIDQILADVRGGVAVETIGARFHNTLVNAIGAVVDRVGCEQVALTGGCFQNALLLRATVCRLREMGVRPYWHQRVPSNDGGIALGQVLGALRRARRRMHALQSPSEG